MPTFLRGDARTLPLADDSVDLIVTSPPYFGLRSYSDGGEHYGGQIGSEPTPSEFLDALIACTAEMVRVLKPSGSIFVNLGDSYYSGKGAPGRTTTDPKNAGRNARREGRSPLDAAGLGIPRKSLVLLPERYRIRCVDDLGLTVRAVIIWQKPNSLPESVQDRVRRSHEDWVHLTLAPHYFSSVDEIREPHQGITRPSYDGRRGLLPKAGVPGRSMQSDRAGNNPLGKLPGSVWEIPTQPLTVPEHLGVDHFAAFPMAWPRRIIQGWCPREVCSACGEFGRARSASSITGYACACPDAAATSTSGVVLDPFSGTGTTALVATMLGRRGIGVDMSADYNRLAQWRAHDPKERARAAGLDPDRVAAIAPGRPDQFDLFGEDTA